jgi:hypothetical protein
MRFEKLKVHLADLKIEVRAQPDLEKKVKAARVVIGVDAKTGTVMPLWNFELFCDLRSQEAEFTTRGVVAIWFEDIAEFIMLRTLVCKLKGHPVCFSRAELDIISGFAADGQIDVNRPPPDDEDGESFKIT